MVRTLDHTPAECPEWAEIDASLRERHPHFAFDPAPPRWCPHMDEPTDLRSVGYDDPYDGEYPAR